MTGKAASENNPPEDTERSTTGVEGLDDILAGGLPRDCIYLVQGDPGSGKTTLALQFLLEGLRQGEKCLYITLSETKEELLKVTRSHGWSLDGIVLLDLSAISAASDGKGQGATFTVSIPMVAARQTGATSTIDSATDARFHAASSDADLPSLSGIRVLAVDDVADARDMLRAVLEQFGASVRTAGSAKEALEVLTDWKPDVLLSDIGMPDEDGYALIQRVRQLQSEDVRNTPAVALTGYARVEDRVRALSAGYQTFVPKPVEANELAISIASLIGRANGPSAMKSDAAGTPAV